jgi:hypothetical protein
MAARLLDPKADFSCLSEIDQDLALVMEPRSKFDRVVLAERLVEANVGFFAALVRNDRPAAESPGMRRSA